MNFLKKINLISRLLLAIIALPLLAVASPQDSVVLVPHCTALNGKQILFQFASKEYLKEVGVGMALSDVAGYDTPVVVLDIGSLSMTPPAFQQFVIFHECAHHQLEGHMNNRADRMNRKTINLERETEADCKAIKDLVKYLNYGDSKLEIILSTIKSQFEAASSRKNSAGRPVKKGQFKYYKNVEERNAKLKQCYDEAKASK